MQLSLFDQHWLLGFFEADGTFSCTKSPKGTISVAIKITQHNRNIRALIAVKKLLKTGKLEQLDTTSTCFRIRKHHVLQKSLFPLFDRAPFLTHKYYDYLHLQHYVRHRHWQNYTRRSQRLSSYWGTCLGTKGLQQFLETHHLTRQQAHSLLSVGWLTGFIEGDGSFYITQKSQDRYACGFGISQKHGFFLLQAIRAYFQIQAKVKKNAKYADIWQLDTTAKKDVAKIAKLFRGCFKGITSLRFRLWCRALGATDRPEKMQQLQKVLRKVSSMESVWKV